MKKLALTFLLASSFANAVTLTSEESQAMVKALDNAGLPTFVDHIECVQIFRSHHAACTYHGQHLNEDKAYPIVWVLEFSVGGEANGDMYLYDIKNLDCRNPESCTFDL